MKRILGLFIIIFCSLLILSMQQFPNQVIAATPTPFWSEEFNELNTSTWVIADQGWDPPWFRPENVTIESGKLKITAKEENYGGLNYTSGMIYTLGEETPFLFGGHGEWSIRASIKAAQDSVQSLVPAFWAEPDNIIFDGIPNWNSDPTKIYGEIDFMENGPWNTNNYYVSFSAYSGECPGQPYNICWYTNQYNVGVDITAKYHEYRFDWIYPTIGTDTTYLKWYFDGTLYKTLSYWEDNNGYPHPFGNDDKFFIILFLNAGLDDGAYPQSMYVNWVRVYHNDY